MTACNGESLSEALGSCNQPPVQALLGGARLRAGKKGFLLPYPSGTTSAALAPRVQGLSLWLHTRLSTSAGRAQLLHPSCCGEGEGLGSGRAHRTSRSCAPPCGPGSSGTPQCRGCSRRRGRCSGRAGSWGSPRSRAGSGRTAARTPRGSSGTGPSPRRRRRCKSLGRGTRTLQGEGERRCVSTASPKRRALTAAQPRAKGLTYVGIRSARTQRCQERICHTAFQQRWDDTGTVLHWGRKPNSGSPGGHTGMLSREKNWGE